MNTTTEHPLITYKNFAIIDSGPVEGGDPGDCRITIKSPDGEIATQSIFYKAEDGASLNKGIVKAKEWIDQWIHSSDEVQTEEKPRYSEDELEEFKGIITGKLNAAKKEEEYLQSILPKGGSESMEMEQLQQMLKRQQTFIGKLEEALARIEDKTYGICRVTGKLIDKTRLRAVPHATLSMEAKMAQSQAAAKTEVVTEEKKEAPSKSKKKNPQPAQEEKKEQPAEEVVTETPERKCRECGCTQNDCRQCIEKTGSPCHWVENDLCSACQQESDVKVIDTRVAADENQLAQHIPGNPTNFFSQFTELVPSIDVTLRIFSKDGKLTVGLFPSLKSKQKPINLAGTPQEIDENFFTDIIPKVKEVKGLVSNLDQLNKKTDDGEEDTKEKAARPKKKAKPAKKKSAGVSPRPKTTQRKPVKNKVKADTAAVSKKLQPTELLAAVIGEKPVTRVDAMRALNEYITKNNLKDQKNRRIINTDDKLKELFAGKSQLSMFDLPKMLAKNMKPQGQAEKPKPAAKPKQEKPVKQEINKFVENKGAVQEQSLFD